MKENLNCNRRSFLRNSTLGIASTIVLPGFLTGCCFSEKRRTEVVNIGNKHPVKVAATGGRQRRVTGDIYDFFSMEFEYENGQRTHCTSRQIGGCDNLHTIMVYGTKGYTNCTDTIFNTDGTVAWKYPFPKERDADQSMAVLNPYLQEQIRQVTAIRTNTPVNDTEQHVQSTLMAIMGRMSAYTGKIILGKSHAVRLETGP